MTLGSLRNVIRAATPASIFSNPEVSQSDLIETSRGSVPNRSPAPMTLHAESATRHRLRSLSTAAVREVPVTPSEVRDYFKSNKDFRSISESPEVERALQAIANEKKGTTPIFWGFRQYTEGDALTDAEVNSLRAFKEIGTNSSALELSTPVILADIHADHNGIPREVYLPYYQKIKATAEELQIPAVWLSDIYEKLGLKSKDIASAGAKLIQKHTGSEPDVAKLSERDYVRLKTQAETLCKRYPLVFDEVLKLSSKKRGQFFGDKGLEYARFRAGEEVLVNRLGEYFGTATLPVHVADPTTSEPIGVKGLFIHARDNENETTVHIPWGATK